jgi:SAM-dependent methyltransferase
MSPFGEGNYDALYAAQDCHFLWGSVPGRLVASIGRHLESGRVLDAGCGDGKNAVYLESRGFDVEGFDISVVAISELQRRYTLLGRNPGRFRVADAGLADLPAQIDCLVSYGLYHCLPTANRLQIHGRLQACVKQGGIMIFTALTDSIPMPESHRTTEIALAKTEEIDSLLEGWHCLTRFSDTLEESHPPLVGKHQHSALWLVARKD